MENENTENETPKNETEGTVENPVENETPKNEEEVVTLNKTEFEKLKKQADLAPNYKVRAEKAEGKLKERKEEKDELLLSPKDTIALVNEKVHTEDFETVTDWAKFKKIPIAEALKDSTLRTVLKEKAEERRTAAATNTKGSPKGVQKESPEDIVEKARRGEVGEDDESIRKLAEAQHALKLKKLSN